MRALAGLFSALFWISGAQAQVSNDYIDLFQSVIEQAESGELDGAYSRVDDLLAISDTTEEAIRSRDLATNIAMAAGRWLDAENQAYAGAELVRTQLGGTPDYMILFLERQAEAARQQGAMDRFHRLQAEARSIQWGRPSLVWNSERGGQRHRFTGFLCPETLNGWPLYQWEASNPDGSRTICMYRDPGEMSDGLALQIGHVDSGDRIEELAEGLMSGEIAASFVAGSPVQAGQHDLTYHAAILDDRHVQVWRAAIADWQVTLESITGAGITTDSHGPLITSAFSGLDRMNDHVSRCDLSRGARQFGAEEEIAGISMTMFTAALLPYPVGRFHADEDTLDCLIGSIDIGGLEIAYAEVDQRGRPLRLIARTSSGEVPYFIAAQSPQLRNVERNLSGRTRGGMPFIMSQHITRRVETYGIFDGAPSADAFLAHVELIASGEITPRTGVFLDESGQSVIDISGMTDD